jgi:hypothetical protein
MKAPAGRMAAVVAAAERASALAQVRVEAVEQERVQARAPEPV